MRSHRTSICSSSYKTQPGQQKPPTVCTLSSQQWRQKNYHYNKTVNTCNTRYHRQHSPSRKTQDLAGGILRHLIDVGPMLAYCWPSVADAVPAIDRHRTNSSCVVGKQWRHYPVSYCSTQNSSGTKHWHMVGPVYSDAGTAISTQYKFSAAPICMCFNHLNCICNRVRFKIMV